MTGNADNAISQDVSVCHSRNCRTPNTLSCCYRPFIEIAIDVPLLQAIAIDVVACVHYQIRSLIFLGPHARTKKVKSGPQQRS